MPKCIKSYSMLYFTCCKGKTPSFWPQNNIVPTYLHLALKWPGTLRCAAQDFTIALILWRGRSLEPVPCCRCFGPSTSRPRPELWWPPRPHRTRTARPLSERGQEKQIRQSRQGHRQGLQTAIKRTDLCLVVVNGRVLLAAQIFLLEFRGGSVNAGCFCCRGD